MEENDKPINGADSGQEVANTAIERDRTPAELADVPEGDMIRTDVRVDIDTFKDGSATVVMTVQVPGGKAREFLEELGRGVNFGEEEGSAERTISLLACYMIARRDQYPDRERPAGLILPSHMEGEG